MRPRFNDASPCAKAHDSLRVHTDRLSKYTRGRRLMLGLGMGLLAGGTVDLRDWMRDKLEQNKDDERAKAM